MCTAFLESFESSCNSYYHIERSRETFLVIIYNSQCVNFEASRAKSEINIEFNSLHNVLKVDIDKLVNMSQSDHITTYIK